MIELALRKKKHRFALFLPFLRIAVNALRVSKKITLATATQLTNVLNMDKFIDIILNEISKDINFSPQSLYNFENENDKYDYLKAYKYLKYNNIILENNHHYSLSENGYEIIEYGGWINYNKILKERKRRNELKDFYDFKISKFQANTKYLPYILSLLSFIIACFAYFKPLDKSNQQQLSKDEILYIIDSISTSNQTKMVDSSHNSKIQTDSLIKK